MNAIKMHPIRSKIARPSVAEGRAVVNQNGGVNTPYFLRFFRNRRLRDFVFDLSRSRYVLVKVAYFWYHKECTKTALTLSLTPTSVSTVKAKGGDDD